MRTADPVQVRLHRQGGFCVTPDKSFTGIASICFTNIVRAYLVGKYHDAIFDLTKVEEIDAQAARAIVQGVDDVAKCGGSVTVRYLSRVPPGCITPVELVMQLKGNDHLILEQVAS